MIPSPIELSRLEGRTPAWEVALLYPDQGAWSAEEYLSLDAGRHIEFTEGRVELLPMPTVKHQAIVLFLVNALRAWASVNGGRALMAPLPVRIAPGRFREPDVVFLKRENEGRIHERFWDGADLVVEVVSEGNRDRDLEIKRAEYAAAGIPEYWLVDPENQTLTVLLLQGATYAMRGPLGRGERAASALLPDFSVDVGAVLDAR